MQRLTRIVEPLRLLLSWQQSEVSGSPYCAGGRRYIIGQLARSSITSNDVRLEYFLDSPDFKEAREKGFDGYPAFRIDQSVHTHDVMAAFARRVPSKARGDYAEYLSYWRISSEAGREMTPFALMGYTGGILPGDGFNLIHTFEEASPPCELIIEVAGVRHYSEAMQMAQARTLEGQQVELIAEPDNPYDAQAVCIKVADYQIGHVKRGQTGLFNRWLGKANFSAHVERVNGRQERPCVLLYVTVS